MSENENIASSSLWPAGTAVFLRDDPGRKGYVIGSRPKSDGTRYQVRWEDGPPSWHPEYALAKREEEDLNVFSLLDKERYGRLGDLRRNITFIQLSGKLADMVYSMDTTNTEFLAYQYKPVLAFLKSPSNGILIADEVGLGKTIEAGLIWTELRARHDDARRLVVVCPAMLREKWCDELKTRFGVDAIRLSASELCKELERPWYDIPGNKGYVCSLQGLARQLAGGLEDFKQIDPVIDLLIIDEAHYLRNPETQNARLGKSLRDISKHVVLLSATPINVKERDLFSLLRLVDPDAFEKEEEFSEVLEANKPLVEAREFALDPNKKGADIIEKLEVVAKHPLLKGREKLEELLAQNIDDEYLVEKANRIDLANEIDRINLLFHTVNRTRKIEVERLRRIRNPRSHFVPLDEEGPEMEFYRRVTNSIRNYAQAQAISGGFLLATPQRMVSSCMYAAAKSWRDRTDITGQDWEAFIYENLGVDLGMGNRNTENDKVSPLINHIAQEVLPDTDINALRKTDTKYEKFSEVVHEYLKEHPEEKIVVFSHFKGTLRYLSERLGEGGLETQLLHGGIGKTKQKVIDQFRKDRKVRVLLASEVASEGVDLQFSKTLINYDLPWNPMKIEQRIGRIDRIGQEADKIDILNFGCKNTIDDLIYERLLKRLRIFERALGGMEAILGEKIQELITSELLSQPLTPEQEKERKDKVAMAMANNIKIQEELEKQASHLFAHGGYILEQVKAAHEFKRRITNEDIMLYVKDYLDSFCQGHQFITEAGRDSMKVKIQLPTSTAVQFAEFIDKHRLQGKSRLSKGNPVICRFENKVVQQRSEIESISQLHPFVRFISAKLIQENKQFYPLIAVEIKQQSLPELELGTGIYAFSAKRWAFDGLRKEEHLRARAVRLASDELLDGDQSMVLINIAKVKGGDWFSVANEIGDVESVKEAFDKCSDRLEEDYQIAKGDYENENADRVTFQIRSTEKYRDRSLESLERLLQQHKEKGNEQATRLTESRIRTQTNEFGVKIEGLKQKRKTTSHSSDVVYGVIRVTK